MVKTLARSCRGCRLVVCALLVLLGSRTIPASDAGDVGSGASAEPRVTAHHAGRYEFDRDEVVFESTFEFAISRAPAQSLAIELPEGVEIDHVQADGLSDELIDDEGFTLTLKLRQPVIGRVTANITGHFTLDPEFELDELLLPVLRPLEAVRETGVLHLFSPPALAVVVNRDDLLGAVPSACPAGDPPAGLRHVGSYEYRRRPIEILVKTVETPLRVAARTVTTVTVSDVALRATSDVQYQIEAGVTDTFAFRVPRSIEDSLTLTPASTGPQIAQITRASEPDEDARVWTLVTRRPVADRLSLQLAWEQPCDGPPPETEMVVHDVLRAAGVRSFGTAVRKAVFEAPCPLGPVPAADAAVASLRHCEGSILVQAGDGIRITSIASDPDDMIARVAQSTYASANRLVHYREEPPRLSLEWTSRPPVVVRPAVERAAVEIALAGAGIESTARYRCRYHLRSPAVQQLTIDLPGGPEESSLSVERVLIDGEAMPVDAPADGARPGWKSLHVDLSRRPGFLRDPASENTGSFEPARTLEICFDVELDRPAFRGFGSPLQLQLPRFIDGSAVWVSGPQQVAVAIPHGFALVGTPPGVARLSPHGLRWGYFGVPVGESDPGPLHRWFNEEPQTPGGRVSDRTESRATKNADADLARCSGHFYRYVVLHGQEVLILSWWNTTLATWVLSGAAALIGVLLAATSWRNRLTVSLAIAFATVMAAAAVPDVVVHGLAAAAPGVGTALLLWILLEATRRRSTEAGSQRSDAGSQKPEAQRSELKGSASELKCA